MYVIIHKKKDNYYYYPVGFYNFTDLISNNYCLFIHYNNLLCKNKCDKKNDRKDYYLK